MSAKLTKIILVIGAIILSVLLFIAPKTKALSNSDSINKNNSKSELNIESSNLNIYLNLATKNLSPDLSSLITKFLKEKQIDSLILFWDKQRRPDLAAHFAEEKSKSTNISSDWVKAGDRYYYATQFSEDKSEIPVLFNCAMRCYTNGLKIEPSNTDAKIMLASCYVEGSTDPMKGISLLKEVESKDSNNVKLQLSFAFFSVKSGQLEKAEKRFQKVLKIDSSYIEAYLHLADLYEQQGKTNLTIKALEKYGAKTGDPTSKAEIYKYIEQLKKTQASTPE
ncbi:MAG: tetratricopeptide repeat protein [Sphingobacteriaceae bacterium]|nr:tetratricopeptide repeat protein [Sphingobacteriaceae bacterium]